MFTFLYLIEFLMKTYVLGFDNYIKNNFNK